MTKGSIILPIVAIVFLFATGQPAYAWLVLAVLVIALSYKFVEAMRKGVSNPKPKSVAEHNSRAVEESKIQILQPQKPLRPKPLIEQSTRKEEFCTNCGAQRVNVNDLFCVSCGTRFDAQK